MGAAVRIRRNRCGLNICGQCAMVIPMLDLPLVEQLALPRAGAGYNDGWPPFVGEPAVQRAVAAPSRSTEAEQERHRLAEEEASAWRSQQREAEQAVMACFKPLEEGAMVYRCIIHNQRISATPVLRCSAGSS